MVSGNSIFQKYSQFVIKVFPCKNCRSQLISVDRSENKFYANCQNCKSTGSKEQNVSNAIQQWNLINNLDY